MGSIYGTGSVTKGDIVYQYSDGSATGGTSGETARAKVQSTDSRESPKVLSLADVSGKWVSGTTSSPTYLSKKDQVSTYATVVGSTDQLGIRDEAKNYQIETDADTIINFSEANPFGDP